MDENLTDQQRAQQVREWFAANGVYLLAGLALGLAALVGWRQWTAYGTVQGEKASALYEELLGAVRVGRNVRAEEITAELGRDFASTPYVDHARLVMARIKIEQSQPDEAIRFLDMVVKDPASDGMADIARLRLGRLLIQEEKYDEALKMLEPPKGSAFEARYREVRGDAYYAQGKNDEAAKEYEAAIASAREGVVDPAFLQAKLDEVRSASASAAGTAAAAVTE